MNPSQGRVVVCGLGPGGRGDVTQATQDLLAGGSPVFLRTRRHPTAVLALDALSFDEVYDAGTDLPSVYRSIAEALAVAASQAGRVVYAVPGSPLILERSVRHLRSIEGLEVEVLPAISFLDAAWARLGVDPVEESVRLVDGHTFARDAAGERGPLLVAHAHASWVLSDIKLAIDAGPEQRVLVLRALGTPDESIVEVAWPDLDRVVEPDHLTSLYLPEVHAPVARELQKTIELMARLRAECPWDREQSHGSLRRHLIEETYEVIEALDRLADAEAAGIEPSFEDYALLEEELGDLWFQILFHTELAGEAGQFSIADVARTLHDKLVVRHPHVFAGAPMPASSADLVGGWEEQKRQEKARESAMDGIPPGLPALALAEKLLKKATRSGGSVGDGWLAESLAHGTTGGLTDDDALGAHLLAATELARRNNLDPEQALRRAAMTAIEDFRRAEARSERWVLG